MPYLPRDAPESFQRMTDRLQRELGEQLELPLAPAPAPPELPPPERAPEPQPREQIELFSPETINRIRRRLEESMKAQEPPPEDEGPPRDLAEVEARINRAGRQMLLLKLTYHGKIRYVEPYSFRYRDKDNPQIPLLMAYNPEDGFIKSFKLLKILREGDLRVTDRLFQPRWPVEF